MEDIIKISISQLALAYIFVAILFFVLKSRGIKKEWELLIATIRMTIQLVLAGFILTFIFDKPSPLLTIGIFLVMELFAIATVLGKFRKDSLPKGMKKVVASSLFIGTSISLLFFLFIVIGVSPWFNPRYFIPIAGMVVGNAMTGVALALRLLLNGMNDRRDLVEEVLVLGGTKREASSDVVNSAFEAAIMPTITSMMSTGIVILPGMMTGQILAGASPMTAILYQIVAMLAILGSVSISVILILELGYRLYFNKDSQLLYK